MSAIKNGKYPIMLDKERHLCVTLNALDEIQDKFGSYDKISEAFEGRDKLKNLKWILALLINEGAEDGEPEITEKQVGKLINIRNMSEVQSAIFSAFSLGIKGDAEKEDDSKNQTASGEQTN